MIPACKNTGVMNLMNTVSRNTSIHNNVATYRNHWLGSSSWKPPKPHIVSSGHASVTGLAVSFRPEAVRQYPRFATADIAYMRIPW